MCRTVCSSSSSKLETYRVALAGFDLGYSTTSWSCTAVNVWLTMPTAKTPIAMESATRRVRTLFPHRSRRTLFQRGLPIAALLLSRRNIFLLTLLRGALDLLAYFWRFANELLEYLTVEGRDFHPRVQGGAD